MLNDKTYVTVQCSRWNLITDCILINNLANCTSPQSNQPWCAKSAFSIEAGSPKLTPFVHRMAVKLAECTFSYQSINQSKYLFVFSHISLLKPVYNSKVTRGTIYLNHNKSYCDKRGAGNEAVRARQNKE